MKVIIAKEKQSYVDLFALIINWKKGGALYDYGIKQLQWTLPNQVSTVKSPSHPLIYQILLKY